MRILSPKPLKDGMRRHFADVKSSVCRLFNLRGVGVIHLQYSVVVSVRYLIREYEETLVGERAQSNVSVFGNVVETGEPRPPHQFFNEFDHFSESSETFNLLFRFLELAESHIIELSLSYAKSLSGEPFIYRLVYPRRVLVFAFRQVQDGLLRVSH